MAENKAEDLKAKVEKYLERAKPLFSGLRKTDSPKAAKVYDTAMRYYSDAQHFCKNGEYLNALAALEYAEGWMDAGKEAGLLEG
jgi:hypothetical protein